MGMEELQFYEHVPSGKLDQAFEVTSGLFRRAVDSIRPVQLDTVNQLCAQADLLHHSGTDVIIDKDHLGIFIQATDPTPPADEQLKVLFSQDLEDRFGKRIQTTHWGITIGGTFMRRVIPVRNGVEGEPALGRWTQNQAVKMIEWAEATRRTPRDY
jgi:hypothetical protein